MVLADMRAWRQLTSAISNYTKRSRYFSFVSVRRRTPDRQSWYKNRMLRKRSLSAAVIALAAALLTACNGGKQNPPPPNLPPTPRAFKAPPPVPIEDAAEVVPM